MKISSYYIVAPYHYFIPVFSCVHVKLFRIFIVLNAGDIITGTAHSLFFETESGQRHRKMNRQFLFLVVIRGNTCERYRFV